MWELKHFFNFSVDILTLKYPRWSSGDQNALTSISREQSGRHYFSEMTWKTGQMHTPQPISHGKNNESCLFQQVRNRNLDNLSSQLLWINAQHKAIQRFMGFFSLFFHSHSHGCPFLSLSHLPSPLHSSWSMPSHKVFPGNYHVSFCHCIGR